MFIANTSVTLSLKLLNPELKSSHNILKTLDNGIIAGQSYPAVGKTVCSAIP